MNTIASMNIFATSQRPIWCWVMFWSALVLGFGIFLSPLDLHSGRTWADGAWSVSDSVLKNVDFWCLSSGGAIAVARFRAF